MRIRALQPTLGGGIPLRHDAEDLELPVFLPSSSRRAKLRHCPLAAGVILAGRFRIVGLLGEGGLGEVYTAEDLLVRSPVALKVIHSGLATTPEIPAALLEKLRLARRVTHANVCRLYDVAQCDTDRGETLLFLTMELLSGETLAERQLREPRLRLEKAVDFARQLCDAMDALQAANVVHGDLRPSNIMLTEKLGALHVTLMDFGLARAADAEAAAGPGEISGTPGYLAPERIMGAPATVAGDVYALGIVLAQVLTGLDVFHVMEGTGPLRVLSLPAQATLRFLGLNWFHLVNRCLETDPARRFPSFAAVRADLAAKPGGLVTWNSVSVMKAGLLLTAVALLGTATRSKAIHGRGRDPL